MTTLTLPHTITPTGLQMHPIAKERLRKFCAGKDRLWVTYDDRKPKRSTSQNSYYWGCVLPTISAETGEEVEDLHELFKQRFLVNGKKMVRGHEIVVYRSTTELNVGEFSDFISRIEVWTGIHIPTPEEAGFISS